MNSEAKDALIVGAFFIAYGLLSWVASGGRLPSIALPARRPVIGLDPGLINLARARRDTLMRQEGIDTTADTEEHADA